MGWRKSGTYGEHLELQVSLRLLAVHLLPSLPFLPSCGPYPVALSSFTSTFLLAPHHPCILFRPREIQWTVRTLKILNVVLDEQHTEGCELGCVDRVEAGRDRGTYDLL